MGIRGEKDVVSHEGGAVRRAKKAVCGPGLGEGALSIDWGVVCRAPGCVRPRVFKVCGWACIEGRLATRRRRAAGDTRG